MSEDWEEGKPPSMLEIDAFVLGHVRRGWRDGDSFIFTDCTHPQQSIAAPLECLSHWRARSPIAVIRAPASNYSSIYAYSSQYGRGGMQPGFVGIPGIVYW